MKTLGMIAGMSPESSLLYYQIINREVNRRLGGNSSADLLIHSVNFETITALQRAGDWQQAGKLLADSARRLEQIGAQGLVLATNTMHKVADAIEAASALPLLHIADPTAAAIQAAGLQRVGLLGTRFTMEQPFYRQRLEDRHGIQVLVPDEPDRAKVPA